MKPALQRAQSSPTSQENQYKGKNESDGINNISVAGKELSKKKENIDTEEAKRINVFLGEQFSQNIKNEEKTTRIQKILIVLYAPQQV